MNQNNSEPSEVTFVDFVFLQYQQALLSLGQFPNPMTGKYDENLPVARYTIDTLAMLEEKTKGNLEENEEKLLGNVLHELRMVYVEKTHAAGKKKAEGTEKAAGPAAEPEGGEAKGPGNTEAEDSGTEGPATKAGPEPAVAPDNVIQMPPPSDEESPKTPEGDA